MNPKIGIHELIGWLNADQNMIIERVLWIDEQYSFAFLYDIEAKKGFPREIAMADLLEAIEDERAIKISQDPWIRSSHDENLTDKQKEIRDKAWEIIRPLAKAEPAIYLRQERGKLIKKTIESYNEGKTQDKLVERTVYGYLRRYWQRGKNINALLPDLQNSSGKGKRRKAGEAKMGRKKKYQSHPDIYEGVNVTETDRQIFRQTLDQYYLNMSDLSLSHVYIRMVQKYYQVEIEFDENKDKVGDTLIKIKSLRSGIPTFEQFSYFYRTEYTQIEVLEKRKGKKGFGANYRPLTGSAHAQIYGVGSQFQIDATTANVYLISKYNPELVIGRPTIYVVIDAFSHLIVGFYVGLKAPSWESAMTALANVATNKVELCREYGVEIKEEQWPCEELPMAIYADKGEMLWKPIETIIQNLDIVVDQAAAYRPDWKGLVESRFWIIRNKLEKILPGYVHLYVFVQEDSYKDAKITENVIREVAKEKLKVIQPMLDELKEGKPSGKYDDLGKINIELDCQNLKQEISKHLNQSLDEITEEQQNSQEDVRYRGYIVVKLLKLNLGISAELAAYCAEKVYNRQKAEENLQALVNEACQLALGGQSQSKQGKSSKPKDPKDEMGKIIAEAKKTEQSNYEALKAQGIVINPQNVEDFFSSENPTTQ
ncbi:MAG: hypothetical protein AB4041_05505 [Microcystaceae cyanobacterium]